MALTNTAVTVTATATQIVAPNGVRGGIDIENNGAVAVYLGDANVTAATGEPLAPGAVYSPVGVNLFRGAFYGITASGSADVRALEY